MKDKLTFVYNDGSTYTTKRNVTWFHNHQDSQIFAYVTEDAIESGIQVEQVFRIPTDELSAVIVHRNNDFNTSIISFNKTILDLTIFANDPEDVFHDTSVRFVQHNK